jgi:hypothetical protein
VVVAIAVVVVAPPPDIAVVGVDELLPLLHAAKRTAEKATAPIPRKDLRTELIETPFCFVNFLENHSKNMHELCAITLCLRSRNAQGLSDFR